MFAQFDGLVECDLYPETRYDLVAQAFGCHGEKVDELGRSSGPPWSVPRRRASRP